MARPKSVNKADETVIADETVKTDETVVVEESAAEKTEVKAAETVTEKVEEPKSSANGYTVVCAKRANKTIVAVTGKAINFDADGIAKGVDLNDAVYLKALPDVEVKGL